MPQTHQHTKVHMRISVFMERQHHTCQMIYRTTVSCNCLHLHACTLYTHLENKGEILASGQLKPTLQINANQLHYNILIYIIPVRYPVRTVLLQVFLVLHINYYISQIACINTLTTSIYKLVHIKCLNNDVSIT